MHFFFLSVGFYVENKSSSTSVVWENAAVLSCCDALGVICGRQCSSGEENQPLSFIIYKNNEVIIQSQMYLSFP